MPLAIRRGYEQHLLAGDEGLHCGIQTMEYTVLIERQSLDGGAIFFLEPMLAIRARQRERISSSFGVVLRTGAMIEHDH